MKVSSKFRGPSLTLLGTIHILLFAAGLVAAATLRHGAPYINPFAAAEAVRAFFEQNPAAVRVSNFFLFASAVPLGLFAVTMVSRLQFLGVRAAGTKIALFGGLTAASALILSGLFGWVLSLSDVAASVPVVRAIFFLSFLFGGAAYAVGFGLLAAGVCVTCYFFCLLPRWLVVLGMLVAVAGEFSSLSLLVYPANFLIPVTRYLGFIWLMLAAVKLPKSRDAGDVVGVFEA
ncbi:hypothetical protein [Tunturibacter empetritectus]|uniref:DUF4386 domain-containing protein n=1 Tax=Tunturiibacter lichenicola TaxID=2051959 RepID=A0A7W8J7B5_9BACT|nr:hypothetical protein [Edaphobacter lichenicola]MBB5343987.1 hypothetical protein [Edaphobacter lichenicola]